MFHYTRPSFNTDLPPDAVDGVMAGSHRHSLNPNDLTIKVKQAKVRKPKGKVDKNLTTRSKPIAIQRKKKKKK